MVVDLKPIPERAGVGLKPEHYGAIFDSQPDIGFFEVHAENYMGAGGLPHRALTAIRENWPLSVHGVGLSIGAERELDADHLARLKAVVDRYQPGLVSEHLAWSTHDTTYFNDLLPVPYTEEVLARVVAHIDQVQTHLGRTILMENPSTYVAFAQSEMSEIEFITQMQQRTGCGLLLDVNNVHVSANNQQYDAQAYIDDFPIAHVGEIHLGGHAEDRDDAGGLLLIDAHDRAVADPVWGLYGHLIGKAGPLPTLIEWDNDVPEWDVLKADADAAEAMLNAARKRQSAA
jgi:uncharacterized protein (UPF0276 family)